MGNSGFLLLSLRLLPAGDEILAPCLAFSDLPQEGGWGTTLQRGKEGESTVLAFAGKSGGEPQCLLVALGWSRVLIV